MKAGQRSTTESRKNIRSLNLLQHFTSSVAHVTVYSSFDLDADRTIILPGDTVTFTPKLDGIATLAQRWTWVSDTDSTEATDCTADSTCKRLITTSGTMWAYLSATPGVGGSASKHVTLTKCQPEDSLLNKPGFRKGMKTLWDSSHVADPDKNNRRERMVLFFDSAGTILSQMAPFNRIDSLKGPCQVNVPNTFVIRGDIPLVAIGHDHPFFRGEQYASNGCPNAPNHYIETPTTGFASGTDWKNSKRTGRPWFIIDGDQVLRIDGASANVQPIVVNTLDYSVSELSRGRGRRHAPLVRQTHEPSNRSVAGFRAPPPRTARTRTSLRPLGPVLSLGQTPWS
jgi:hypothetical protein